MGKLFQRGILYVTVFTIAALMYPKYYFADGTYRIIIEGHEMDELDLSLFPDREAEIYALMTADPSQIQIESKLLEYLQTHRN